MSNDLLPIGVDLQAKIDQWSRNIRKAQRQAGDLEKSLDDIVSTANRAEKALNGVATNIDSNINVNEADLDAAVRLRDLLDEDVNIDANVNEADLNTAKRKRDDLDGATTLRANVNEADLDAANRLREDLDGSTTLRVNADIDDTLNKLLTVESISLAVELAGGAGGALGIAGGLTGGAIGLAFEVSGVQELIEIDNLMSNLEGTTSRTIPNARELILDIYANGWGESVADVQQAVTLTEQLGVDLEKLPGIVEQAFATASIAEAMGQELDVADILATQAALVEQNVVPDFEAAGDLLATGLTNGFNLQDDWADTLLEYSPNIAQFTDNGEQVANLMASGLESGFMNTDLIGDAIREFGIRINQELGDNEDLQAAYDELGLLDDALQFSETGEGGAELLSDVSRALNDIDDAGHRAYLSAQLFGSQVEDIAGNGPIMLDPLSGEFDDIGNAAKDAADTVNDDLMTALEVAGRTLRTRSMEYFNQELELDTFIGKVTDGIDTAFEQLEGGNEFGDSLAIAVGVALDDTTLGETLNEFANIGIEVFQAMLEAIADVFDILGEDSSARALRGGIADVEEFQLGLTLSSSESSYDITTQIRGAIELGVTGARIGEIMSENLDAAVARGDFETAAAIQDSFWLAGTLDTELFGDDFVAQWEEAAPRYAAAMNDALTTALANEDVDAMANILPALDDPEQIEQIASEARDAFLQAWSSGDKEGAASALDLFEDAGGDNEQYREALEEMQTEQEETAASAEESATRQEEANTRAGDSATAMSENSTTAADTVATNATTTADTVEEQNTRVSESYQVTGETLAETLGVEGDVAAAITAFADLGVIEFERFEIAGTSAVAEIQKALGELVTTLETTDISAPAVEGGAAGGGGGGGATEVPAFNEGGVAQGLFSWNPQEELAFSDERIAILNDATTQQMREIFAGMSQGSTTVNNTYNYNVATTFNTQSRAQDVAGLNSLYAQTRGL